MVRLTIAALLTCKPTPTPWPPLLDNHSHQQSPSPPQPKSPPTTRAPRTSGQETASSSSRAGVSTTLTAAPAAVPTRAAWVSARPRLLSSRTARTAAALRTPMPPRPLLPQRPRLRSRVFKGASQGLMWREADQTVVGVFLGGWRRRHGNGLSMEWQRHPSLEKQAQGGMVKKLQNDYYGVDQLVRIYVMPKNDPASPLFLQLTLTVQFQVYH